MHVRIVSISYQTTCTAVTRPARPRKRGTPSGVNKKNTGLSTGPQVQYRKS